MAAVGINDDLLSFVSQWNTQVSGLDIQDTSAPQVTQLNITGINTFHTHDGEQRLSDPNVHCDLDTRSRSSSQDNLSFSSDLDLGLDLNDDSALDWGLNLNEKDRLSFNLSTAR